MVPELVSGKGGWRKVVKFRVIIVTGFKNNPLDCLEKDILWRILSFANGLKDLKKD